MYKSFFKRTIDLVIGILALPVFFFFYIIVALAIKLDDGGPIFYCNDRLGKGLKKYKMYKFRSMVINAADIRNKDGSTFNSMNDARLTRVGRVIRKLSIDELPQILNVIKGDMSLIGPRPSPCGNTHLYSEEYMQKFNIRPGVTGYTQAFFRNNASIEQKQKSDIYYVKHMSFLLDVKVLLKTFSTVLKQQGLYTNEKSN
ncbi:sugar transferase [Priestia filamentosa]|uniref:sugar transferase n=1 Tax=Priestia filamentosa TaxID=1402861 RepID=UPI00397C350C